LGVNPEELTLIEGVAIGAAITIPTQTAQPITTTAKEVAQADGARSRTAMLRRVESQASKPAFGVDNMQRWVALCLIYKRWEGETRIWRTQIS